MVEQRRSPFATCGAREISGHRVTSESADSRSIDFVPPRGVRPKVIGHPVRASSGGAYQRKGGGQQRADSTAAAAAAAAAEIQGVVYQEEPRLAREPLPV